MTVYAIGMISITDRETYNRYSDLFMSVLERHGGRLLVADEQVMVEEGDWPHDKLILLQFESEPAFRAWSESPEYRAIAKDRHAGSRGTVVLARGVEDR